MDAATTRRRTINREDMANSVRVKQKKYYDYTLLFLIVFLVAFGIVMISSISAFNATKYYNDAFLFTKQQIKFAAGGFVLLFLVSMCNYHWISRRFLGIQLVTWIYLGCLILQIAVLFLGKTTNGSARWFSIGGFSLQPSELSKIGVLLFFAAFIQKSPKKLDSFFYFCIVGMFAAPMFVLVAEENFSTGFIIAAIVVVMCFIVSRKNLYYIIVCGFVAGVGALYILKEGYRAARVSNWLNIEESEDGYQILQGLYAITSGGWFGKGLGNSIQKLGYIPEVHTDMIFSCICEELGLFGAIFLLIVYAILLWRIFLVGLHAPDLFGSLIVCGVFTQIAIQVLINVAVVTNTMPATGIPLPLISYGGSSLVFTLLELGLVLCVARQINYNEQLAPRESDRHKARREE